MRYPPSEAAWTLSQIVLNGPTTLELLKFLNARDTVKSDHDSYVHDGGGANLVLTERLLTCHYEAKKLSSTLMNKNISGVVVRGIVLIIIVYLLSMRVE